VSLLELLRRQKSKRFRVRKPAGRLNGDGYFSERSGVPAGMRLVHWLIPTPQTHRCVGV
jgi:hypothetical protein